MKRQNWLRAAALSAILLAAGLLTAGATAPRWVQQAQALWTEGGTQQRAQALWTEGGLQQQAQALWTEGGAEIRVLPAPAEKPTSPI